MNKKRMATHKTNLGHHQTKRESVRLQTFSHGRYARYWTIAEVAENTAKKHSSEDEHIQEIIHAYHEEQERHTVSERDLFSYAKLVIDPETRLLICCHKQCGYALAPQKSHILTHIQAEHNIHQHTLSKLEQYLQEHLHSLGLYAPHEVPRRQDGSPEHINLQAYKGYACRKCDFRVIGLVTIKWHVSKYHISKEPGYRTRIESLYDDVYLQTWKSTCSQQYWIIEREGSTIRKLDGKNAQFNKQNLLGGEQRECEDTVDKSHSILPLVSTELRPWLERTRWAETYEGKDWDLLRNLITSPHPSNNPNSILLGRIRVSREEESHIISTENDEKKIAILASLIDEIMARCENTAKTTSRNLLCWLKSTKMHAPYPKPFTLVESRASKSKYYRLFKQFIAMIFRASRISPRIRRQAGRIRFRKTQLLLIDAIWNHEMMKQYESDEIQIKVKDNGTDNEAEASESEESEAEESETESSEIEDTDQNSADTYEDRDKAVNKVIEEYETASDELDEYETASETSDSYNREVNDEGDELLELLFSLCIAFSTEQLIDGQPSSTLLGYFSGILGFSAKSQVFRSARMYTPYLSGLIYVQRLLFLEYALPARSYPTLGIYCRPRTGQLKRLELIRRKYMIVGSQSSFEEFMALRSLGRAFAAFDTPPFLLHWS
jgi:hypothetical protein